MFLLAHKQLQQKYLISIRITKRKADLIPGVFHRRATCTDLNSKSAGCSRSLTKISNSNQ